MSKLMPQKDFFDKYHISEKQFTATGMSWEELEEIYLHHISNTPFLEECVAFIFNFLRKVPSVHSVRYRIKDPEHLIEKIIRKKTRNPDRIITPANYTSSITDLIGVRVLHLFKHEWEPIHEAIVEKWYLKEKPIAYYREGDSPEYIEQFKKQGCEERIHPYGYRSIHYVVNTSFGKQVILGEIQVRTVFEEAWSEIDHTVRYPYDLENPLFKQYLMTFNRLAGSADEMASFMISLKEDKMAQEKALQEKNETIARLRMEMRKLKLTPKQKKEMNIQIDKLEDNTSGFNNLPYTNNPVN